jgi:hypothetical protein
MHSHIYLGFEDELSKIATRASMSPILIRRINPSFVDRARLASVDAKKFGKGFGEKVGLATAKAMLMVGERIMHTPDIFARFITELDKLSANTAVGPNLIKKLRPRLRDRFRSAASAAGKVGASAAKKTAKGAAKVGGKVVRNPGKTLLGAAALNTISSERDSKRSASKETKDLRDKSYPKDFRDRKNRRNKLTAAGAVTGGIYGGLGATVINDRSYGSKSQKISRAVKGVLGGVGVGGSFYRGLSVKGDTRAEKTYERARKLEKKAGDKYDKAVDDQKLIKNRPLRRLATTAAGATAGASLFSAANAAPTVLEALSRHKSFGKNMSRKSKDLFKNRAISKAKSGARYGAAYGGLAGLGVPALKDSGGSMGAREMNGKRKRLERSARKKEEKARLAK